MKRACVYIALLRGKRRIKNKNPKLDNKKIFMGKTKPNVNIPPI